MAGMSGQAIGMAGTIIGLAALAAWLGLAHSCDPATGEPVVAGRVTIAPCFS
jgi:cytochrome c-type biogenesis protein CcmH